MIDLAIVGAGPVGLATAITAHLRGLTSVVFEKRRPPLDKACGEGLMPLGVDALRALGVTPAVSAPIEGIRYVDGATVVEGRFGRPGLGIRRTMLSEALRERAESLGIDVRYGTAYDGSRARYLVGADGLHSSVRERAGIAYQSGGEQRFGVRRHYAVRPWSTCVEVHWANGCEAYVTPVGPELVGVAILGTPHFELAAFPELESCLRDAEMVSTIRGAGPFRHRVHRRYEGTTVLVGDAAGYADAITGEGLTMGFLSAEALVDTIARGAPLADYEHAYRRITRTYYAFTALTLGLARYPSVRRASVRLLARAPRLFEHLLALNAGVRAPSPGRSRAHAQIA